MSFCLTSVSDELFAPLRLQRYYKILIYANNWYKKNASHAFIEVRAGELNNETDEDKRSSGASTGEAVTRLHREPR